MRSDWLVYWSQSERVQIRSVVFCVIEAFYNVEWQYNHSDSKKLLFKFMNICNTRKPVYPYGYVGI